MVRLGHRFFKEFRSSFVYPNKSVLQWFPGHMGKGIREIQNKLKSVDCVVEVHDARIPMSGRNKQFRNSLGRVKPHILVLNKMDLADLTYMDKIISGLSEEGINNVLFISCKDRNYSSLRSLVPMATKLMSDSDRYQRSDSEDYSIMITGVPNVGKSTVINSLRNLYMRKRKAAPTGAIAGITRSVTSKIKVSAVPLIFVLDTPGILEPTVSNMEAGFKLALCSSMQDHLVGTQHIADYLLFWMNHHNNFSYVDYMGVKEPIDDVTELLVLCAVNMNKTVKRRSTEQGYIIQPDTEYAANHFIKGFRTGLFGKVMLDDFY